MGKDAVDSENTRKEASKDAVDSENTDSRVAENSENTKVSKDAATVDGRKVTKDAATVDGRNTADGRSPNLKPPLSPALRKPKAKPTPPLRKSNAKPKPNLRTKLPFVLLLLSCCMIFVKKNNF